MHTFEIFDADKFKCFVYHVSTMRMKIDTGLTKSTVNATGFQTKSVTQMQCLNKPIPRFSEWRAVSLFSGNPISSLPSALLFSQMKIGSKCQLTEKHVAFVANGISSHRIHPIAG